MVGQGISSAGSAIGGAVKGTGMTFLGILKLLFFVKFRWTITIMLLIFYSWGALNQSLEEKNLYPFIYEVGGRVASADETLYWELKEIEANNWAIPTKNIDVDEEDGTWKTIKSVGAKLKFLFNILSATWFLYVLLYMLFWIIDKFNTSGKAYSVMFAILLLILIQALYGTAMLSIHMDCSSCPNLDKRYKDVAFAMTPLKGFGFLIVNAPKIFDDFFDKSAVPYLDKKINESLNQIINSSVV